MPEPKDQAPSGQSQDGAKENGPQSMDDYWGLALEDADIKEGFMEPEPTEGKKTETKPPEKKEEDCVDCGDKGEKKDAAPDVPLLSKENFTDGVWPKRMKVQGELKDVKDSDEAMELMSKGYDYTIKTQRLSDDTKAVETEYQKKADSLTEKLDNLYDALAKKGELPSVAKTERQTEDDVARRTELYREFGISEDFPEDYQVKTVDRILKLEGVVKTQNDKFEDVEKKVNFFGLREASQKLGKDIVEYRKEFPITDVMSEDGKENLTFTQFKTILAQKVQNPENKGKPIPAMAREAIRDISLIQKANASAVEPKLTNDMSAKDFKEKYPDLYAKVHEQGKDEGVADKLSTSSAPTFEPRRMDADTSSKKKSDSPQSMEEYLDAAAREIDFTGGIE